MKKLILILNITLINYCASGQYLDKDFNDTTITSGGWTTQVIIDTTDWFARPHSSDVFANCTNYDNGINSPANTWLISPAVDLSLSTNPTLSFKNLYKYSGNQLKLQISTDYDGISNPTFQGTWTDISSQVFWDNDPNEWGDVNNTQNFTNSQYPYWYLSGDIDVSLFISNSTYIAFEYIGSANSGSNWEVDDIIISEGPLTPPPPPGIDTVSIYDIQFNNNSNGASNYEGSQVYTGGIVYALRDDSSFYLASGSGPWTGVYVFSNDYLLSEGDSVTLTAEVDEFYELTELKNVTNLQVVSSGNTPITNNCSTGAASSEEFEGCLIEVTNANCNNDNAGFGEWIVNDGTGDVVVDDLFYAFVPNLNTNYNVKGAVTFSYGAFKLLPRNSGDVSVFVSIEENKDAIIKIFPNPLNQTYLNININTNNTLSLFDLSGKLIKTFDLKSGNNLLNLEFLNKGLYMVECNSKTYTIAKI